MQIHRISFSSVPALVSELRREGFVTRKRKLGSGRIIGGVPLTNGPLAVILKNRIYLGEINHRGQSFPGEHEPIVDQELFDAVQDRLAANTQGSCGTWRASGALLLGRVYDDRGNLMSPAHANKYPGGKAPDGKTGTTGRVRYRYYVSCAVPQGRKHECGSVPRVSAPEIEELVLAALRTRFEARGSAQGNNASSSVSPALDNPRAEAHIEAPSDDAWVVDHLDRVIVGPKTLELVLKPEVEETEPSEPITISWTRPIHTRKREIHMPTDGETERGHPIRAEARARLVAAIARARGWVAELSSNPQVTITAIAARENLSERSLRMTLPLAFLSPAIVRAAIDGTLPFGTGVVALADLPMEWEQQGRAVALVGKADPRRCIG